MGSTTSSCSPSHRVLRLASNNGGSTERFASAVSSPFSVMVPVAWGVRRATWSQSVRSLQHSRNVPPIKGLMLQVPTATR
eukprot:994395-Pyramimonas_sp.AAC.1